MQIKTNNIYKNYAKDAFDFRENSIVVTIPFNKNRKVGNKVGNEIGDTSPATRKHGLNATRKQILSEMRHNPNITKAELVIIIGISDTAIDNNIRYLKNNGYLERIGSNKDGYWKVVD